MYLFIYLFILQIFNYTISSSIHTDSNYRIVNALKNVEVNDHNLILASMIWGKP